jgi:DNA-binding IclR family transcriptional regulator
MVDRVVLILGVFERSGGTLTLGQVSSRSGLPRTSVHRILQQLVDARLLHRIDNEYMLGLRMFEIGSLVVSRSRLTRVARPLMQELSIGTGHLVQLAVLDGQDVVHLAEVGGGFADALLSRAGGRMPAHCTGVGKALLAFSPRPVVDRHLEGGLGRRTGASISTAANLEVAMARIRDTGYAVERDEAVPGVACVAAPILQGATPVAAVAVCGPRRRVDVDELRHRVLWTAAEISRRHTTTGRTGPVGEGRCPGQRKDAERLRLEPATIRA